jgi:hypothetical protein
MSAVHTLVGTRYSAAGRKTGESEVTLWRGGAGPSLADDILLTVGNRRVWIDAIALREAVVALTGAPISPDTAADEANEACGAGAPSPLPRRLSPVLATGPRRRVRRHP